MSSNTLPVNNRLAEVVAVFRSATLRIAVATLLVFFVGRWGMFHELKSIRRSIGSSQVSEARSHAERTIERLQHEMESRDGVDLGTAANAQWLRDRWGSSRWREPKRAFRAIVDPSGAIVAHTDYRVIGKKMKPHPESSRVPEFGDKVYEARDSKLTGNVQVVDILVPITKSNQVVGTYHVGLPADWLDSKIAQEQSRSQRAWTAVIAYSMIIVVITGLVFYHQARRANLLERKLHFAEGRRLRELSTLMVGMAHEVRNPLNSIRLNLHTLDRIFRGESQLAKQEVSDMLSESVHEIERVESLIGQLLGYARVENACDDLINVTEEIRSALIFIQPTLEPQAIKVTFRNVSSSATIFMDRGRIRQILLNLLKNASDAMPRGGSIEVTFETSGSQARLIVADTGSGVDERIRSRLFEPFVTTRESGTGLGLAVVRSMLDSVDGAIQYQRSDTLGGAEFTVSFPIDRSARKLKNGH